MFRISLLLWLIALAAVNLTLLKYCETIIQLSPKFAGLFGIMPLFDFFALSVYFALTRGFRFALVRRQERKSVAISAAVSSGTFLASGVLLCLLFPEVVLVAVDALYSPFDKWVDVSKWSSENRGFLMGSLLGAIMSGPLIFFVLIFGLLHSRFRLVITRLRTVEE